MDKYVHIHNKVRPIANLGVTPFELLVGWKFRGTYPCLWDSSSRTPIDRAEIKEKDDLYKFKTKQYADWKRGVKESDVTVGDNVLLALHKKVKSDPTFGAEKYTVIARDGAKVVIRSDRGVQFSRNVQDVKKIFQETLLQENDSHITENSSSKPTDSKKDVIMGSGPANLRERPSLLLNRIDLKICIYIPFCVRVEMGSNVVPDRVSVIIVNKIFRIINLIYIDDKENKK